MRDLIRDAELISYTRPAVGDEHSLKFSTRVSCTLGAIDVPS